MWGWALQAYFKVGHCRDAVGYRVVGHPGHCRDTVVGFCMAGSFILRVSIFAYCIVCSQTLVGGTQDEALQHTFQLGQSV